MPITTFPDEFDIMVRHCEKSKRGIAKTSMVYKDKLYNFLLSAHLFSISALIDRVLADAPQCNESLLQARNELRTLANYLGRASRDDEE